MRPTCREDWLDVAETPTETSICLLLPVGREEMLEVRDALYRRNQGEPYHQHLTGSELFYLYEGTAWLTVRGKRCRLTAGDMAFIPAEVPHALLFPDERTGFRLFLQGMNVAQRRMNRNALAAWHPGALEDAAFARELARRNGALPRRHRAEAEVVDKAAIHEVRAEDFAWESFELSGARAHLMVGRWETGGLYEVWRCEAPAGFAARWEQPHGDWMLWQVTAGEVAFETPDERFVARTGELARIPPYTPYAARAVRQSVVHLIGNRGQGLAMLEDRQAALAREPGAFATAEAWKAFTQSYDCHVTWFGMEKEREK